MKLLLVIRNLSGGGAERVLAGMANYWISIGYQVILVTLERSIQQYTLDSRVKHYCLPCNPSVHPFHTLLTSLKQVFLLLNIIHKTKPSAVISFLTTTNIISILASRLHPVRLLVSERCDPALTPDLGLIWSTLRLMLYRHADFVVAQTPPIQSWLIRNTHSNSVVIPNPLRKLPYPPPYAQRERLILAIGRLEHQKGFDLLLHACHLSRLANTSWRLVIIGEGSQLPNLQSLIARYNLASVVTISGYVKNIETWLSRASIVVQPSRYEGISNVILEALAMGTTVICSNSASASFVVDKHNGRVVPTEDPQYLSRVLSEIINDPAQREYLASHSATLRSSLAFPKIMSHWNTLLLSTSQ